MINFFRHSILSVLILATLGACTNFPSQFHTANKGWTPSLIVTSQADELLQYYDFARKLSASELTKEYEKARQNLAQSKVDGNKLRLALLLTLPNTSFKDNATAQTLVNDILKDNKASNPGLHALANLLSASLAEQQEMAQKNKDEQKDLTQKWKDEQKRADGLQEKVDAIKSMEKNLIRRDKH